MNRNNMIVKRRERRRDRRREMQFVAYLGGEEVQLTDLSAAGFGVAIDATDQRIHSYRPGQRLRLDLHPRRGAVVSLAVEIVRPLGENGVVGGVFVGLSDADYNAIEALLTGRFHRLR